jgi:hypothetical protein
LPVPVFLKRLAAPVWVFNLGIFLLDLGVGVCPIRAARTQVSLHRNADHFSITQRLFCRYSAGLERFRG